MPIHIFCPFFKNSIILLWNSGNYLHILDKTLIRLISYKYILPFCDLSSHYPGMIFGMAKVFNFGTI